jgi:hypothetical protein
MLAGMSFSFSAGGTRTQTLDSLAKVTHRASEADKVLADLLIDMVGSGPEEVVGQDVIYAASAYGHSHAGSMPTLSVSLGCSLRPKPEERGGIESDLDPSGRPLTLPPSARPWPHGADPHL